MVNPADWQVQKSPVGHCNAKRKLLLLRIHFLDMIVHNRSEYIGALMFGIGVLVPPVPLITIDP
jgi:hypothetical protein